MLKVPLNTSLYYKAKPFVKWAGGKGQLLPEINKRLPRELYEGRINRYIEPFVGSGALLFHILQNFHFKEAYILDINPEIILVYNVIKHDVDSLIQLLEFMQKEYLSLNFEDRRDYYYKQRDSFNSELNTFDFNTFGKHSVKRAAQFIFLNRTCYNGLFRVNKSGYFNVPMGGYKRPTICNKQNLLSINRLLQKVIILSADYKQSEHFIDSNSFVYFDPPYRPLTKTSNFTSYSKNHFKECHQIELSNFFKKMSQKGAFLLLSNSDPKNINPEDNFFEDIYNGFIIERVNARRNISSKSTSRGNISELLIRNYNN